MATIKKFKLFLIIIFIVIIFSILSLTDVNKIKSEINLKKGITFYNYQYYQKATYFLKKSLEFDSKNYLARYFLGWSYFKSGFLQNAIFEWQNLNSLGYKDNLLENMLNNIFFQEGNPSKDILVEKYNFYTQINGKKIDNTFFSWPLGLEIDPKNNIYIAGHRSFNVLLMSNGIVEKSINIFGDFLGHPYDIAYSDIDNCLYVTDFKNDLIYKLTLNGKILKKIGKDFKGTQKLLGPAGITIDNLNNIYVVDQGNNRIVKIDSNGKFLFAFGGQGREKGKFYKPVDILFDRQRSLLYISNSYNNRVDIFDPWGNYLNSIGEGTFDSPRGLFLQGEKYLYILDKNGVYVYNFDDLSLKKINIGNYKLFDPYFLVIDKNQNLIISEPYKNFVDYFIPKNELYLNLDVRLERIDIRNYPLIVCYISVRDQSGNPIYGLKNENFIFQEGKEIINRVETDYTKLREYYNAISIVIDSSSTLYKYKDKIKSMLKKIFDIDNNRIAYSLYFTENLTQVQKFNYTKLKILNEIVKKENYKGKRYVDINLYNSISSFFRKFVKGAIIYITDGDFKPENFETYSQNDIINYAKNNYIPVYIIYFGKESGKTFLKEFASKTQGRFLEHEQLLHAENILKYYRNYQSPLYIVYYESPYLYAPDFFRKVFVTVQYNSRVGKNWLGYYMEEKGTK